MTDINNIGKNSAHSSQPEGKNVEGSLSHYSVKALKMRLYEIESHAHFKQYHQLSLMEPQYGKQFTHWEIAKAVSIIALLVLSICVFALASTQHLTTFPRDLLHWVQKIEYTQWTIGGAVALIFTLGSIFVVVRAVTKKETLLGKKIEVTLRIDGKKTIQIVEGIGDIPKKNLNKDQGPLIQILNLKYIEGEGPARGSFICLDKHLETVIAKCGSQQDRIEDYYIDTSTLDSNGNGKAYMYVIKPPENHYTVSTVVPFFGTLPYVVATVVWNLMRALIAPLYVLIQYLREKCTGEILYADERAFQLMDIPREFFVSLWRAVKAPFYGLAFFMAALYSLVNPMGGRKLGRAIEYDWNEEVSLAEGYWSIEGGQKKWYFEGGGGPLSLGKNGFYLAGCWQPTGVAEYEEGKIKAAYWLPKAVYPKFGINWAVITRKEVEKYCHDNKNSIAALLEERAKIEKELLYRTQERF